MKTTLGIALEEKQCRAISVEVSPPFFYCKGTQTVQHPFENMDALQDSLALIKPLHHKGNQVVVGIPFQHVMSCELTLDAGLSDADTMRFIAARAVQLFGHSADQLCLDYAVHATDDNQQNITVVAALQSLVHRIQHAFKQAKIPLHVIDVNSYAKMRCDNVKKQSTEIKIPSADYETAFGLCI